MPDEPHQEPMLHIRCPSCSQRFKVGEDLFNRTVECGTCEHRFVIEDEVILRGRKHYPGQRTPSDLGKLQRIEPQQPEMGAAPAKNVTYGDAPDPTQFEPTPPLRIVAACFGGLVILFMMIILIIGADRDSILSSVSTDRRLVMAAFAAVLGSGLLIYGNPKSRWKVIAGSAIASGILVSLPFLFQGGSEVLNPESKASDVAAPPANEADGSPETPETIPLHELVGTTPLEKEIARYNAEGSDKTAIGLWLKNLVPSYQYLVRDFVIRTLGADHQTHYYRREHPITRKQSHLLVVSGTDVEFAEVARRLTPIGEVINEYPEISVIEVEVDNSNFNEGPIKKLGDRNDPAFYELNKRELESIDLKRVEKAVRRLMDAKPRIYQADIQKRLIYLLQADYVDFKGEVARALKQWGTESKEEGEAGMIGLEQLLAKKKPVPTDLVELIIKTGNNEVIPYLDDLWKQSALDWEGLYMLTDESAEPFVLRDLEDATGRHQQSAVRILGKIGTPESIPTLTTFLDAPNVELRLLAEKAILSIRERHGEP